LDLLSENQVIEILAAHAGVVRQDVVLGIGDDGAVLQAPHGSQLVQVLDALFEGVHFPVGTPAADLAWRALAVNLSDLAAMGAEPAWATLALSLPRAERDWILDFASGLQECAACYGVALVGGDTVRGPLGTVVEITGFVPAGMALTRGGARPGDGIYVSGYPGLAAAGLAAIQGRIAASDADRPWRQQFLRPQPRVSEGVQLRTLASACIDLSDGLCTDLARLARASGVAANLRADALPRVPGLDQALGAQAATDMSLAGGDDYELCFTVSPQHQDALARISAQWDCPCTRIGEVLAGDGLRVLVGDQPRPIPPGAFEHFAA